MLLNSTQFSFVIDLAALASRRKYLNLDKWLNDKYREHQVIAIFVCYLPHIITSSRHRLLEFSIAGWCVQGHANVKSNGVYMFFQNRLNSGKNRFIIF